MQVLAKSGERSASSSLSKTASHQVFTQVRVTETGILIRCVSSPVDQIHSFLFKLLLRSFFKPPWLTAKICPSWESMELQRVIVWAEPWSRDSAVVKTHWTDRKGEIFSSEYPLQPHFVFIIWMLLTQKWHFPLNITVLVTQITASVTTFK